MPVVALVIFSKVDATIGMSCASLTVANFNPSSIVIGGASMNFAALTAFAAVSMRAVAGS